MTTSQASRACVLLCDDDRLILATTASALRAAQLEVVEADNGDDAILLARQHRPDLALLDMRMNGKSGLDVAAYLRDYVGTPFLFLSAFGDEKTISQARAFGALDYLVKPIDTRRVVETILALLAQQGGARPQLEGGELPRADAAAQPPSTRSEGETASDTLTAAQQQMAMAVGILMQRKSLTAEAALVQLGRLAKASGQPAWVVAADLVGRLDRANARQSLPAAEPVDPIA